MQARDSILTGITEGIDEEREKEWNTTPSKGVLEVLLNK